MNNSYSPAEVLGAFIGLIIGCSLIFIIGKILKEEYDKEQIKIKNEQKARKNGEKVKKTIKERFWRFAICYLPIIFLILAFIGITALFFTNRG